MEGACTYLCALMFIKSAFEHRLKFVSKGSRKFGSHASVWFELAGGDGTRVRAPRNGVHQVLSERYCNRSSEGAEQIIKQRECSGNVSLPFENIS